MFEDPYAIHFVGDRWRRVIRSRVLDALFEMVLVRKLMPITTQLLTRARFAEEVRDSVIHFIRKNATPAAATSIR